MTDLRLLDEAVCNVVPQKTREWIDDHGGFSCGCDWVPRDVRIEYNRLAAGRMEQLLTQLPEGMKDCTIVFKECLRGHGRLIATNWIDGGCIYCLLENARTEIASLEKLLDEMESEIRGNP